MVDVRVWGREEVARESGAGNELGEGMWGETFFLRVIPGIKL